MKWVRRIEVTVVAVLALAYVAALVTYESTKRGTFRALRAGSTVAETSSEPVEYAAQGDAPPRSSSSPEHWT